MTIELKMAALITWGVAMIGMVILAIWFGPFWLWLCLYTLIGGFVVVGVGLLGWMWGNAIRAERAQYLKRHVKTATSKGRNW